MKRLFILVALLMMTLSLSGCVIEAPSELEDRVVYLEDRMEFLEDQETEIALLKDSVIELEAELNSYKDQQLAIESRLLGTPEITLFGEESVTLQAGTPYTEPGYKAINTLNNTDITISVDIGGDVVDEMVLGTYEITYTVVSETNITETVIRTVNIVDTVGPVITLRSNITEEDLENNVSPVESIIDNYDGEITTYSFDKIDNGETCSTVDSVTTCTTTIVIIITATDSNGNTTLKREEIIY